MTDRAERIFLALDQAFAPDSLNVQDDSGSHAGHAGAASDGQTHYTVLVVSESFRGQSRVARSRAVHDILVAEFATGLHALSLVLRTPEEAGGETSA